MAIGVVTLMLTISWKLTMIAIIPMIVLLFICRSLMPKMHLASVRVQEQLSAISSLAQESFSGSRVVKAFVREDYEVVRFEGESQKYIDDSMRMAMIRARFHTFIEILSGLVSVCVLFFGGRLVIRGELDAGMFVAFFGFFMMLIWPMIAIGWTMSLFQRAAVSLDRLENFLATEVEIRSGPKRLPKPVGAWRIQNLTFAHDDGHPVLNDISIEIAPGQSLAVVGPTGCGKSTLVQLLGRLFDPPTGTVFLDDHDVRDLDLGDLRRSIAMVPQDTFLFSDTIRRNIAFSDYDTPVEQVEQAARDAQLADSIERFANGYDELVGERGVTLSGGQKQRTAIARGLVADATTLVLDDSLSAVDTDTEEKILDRLKEIMRERTTVVVAHRLSTVMACDQIVVLREGRIVEQGRHDDLVAAAGWYAETWRSQLLREELEATEAKS